MSEQRKLRPSEWVLCSFFCYTAILTPFFPNSRTHSEIPLCFALGVFALFWTLSQWTPNRYAKTVSFARDWIPVALTYVAFREMELFASPHYNTALEQAWIQLDQRLLGAWHGRAIIECCGPLIPSYLELCYLLVYGVPAYGVTLLWLRHRRPAVDRFYMLYLLGTLSAYALFPFWPTEPPRFALPSIEPPQILTALHHLNFNLLAAGTIHTGVFPSAHVSSAFAATWALFLLFPDRKRYGYIALAYALSVSLATLYGRYHYMADVLGGFGISLIPAALAVFLAHTQPSPIPVSSLATANRTTPIQ